MLSLKPISNYDISRFILELKIANNEIEHVVLEEELYWLNFLEYCRTGK